MSPPASPAGGECQLVTTVLPTHLAVVHPEHGPATLRMMAEAWRSAFSAKPDRQCFCCGCFWLPKRSPKSIVLVEYVLGGDGGFTAGVCAACTGRADLPARLRKAMERDLGFEIERWHFMAEPGRA